MNVASTRNCRCGFLRIVMPTIPKRSRTPLFSARWLVVTRSLPACQVGSTYGTQCEVPRSESKSVVGTVVIEAVSM